MNAPLPFCAIFIGSCRSSAVHSRWFRSRRKARNWLWDLWQQDTKPGYDPRSFFDELNFGRNLAIKECRYPKATA
jgi:hypothetical protein